MDRWCTCIRCPGKIKGVWTGGGLSLVSSISLIFALSNCAHLITFPLPVGTMDRRWELRHLTCLPGGRGVVLGFIIH